MAEEKEPIVVKEDSETLGDEPEEELGGDSEDLGDKPEEVSRSEQDSDATTVEKDGGAPAPSTR